MNSMHIEKATQFTKDWIKAWNDHDLEAILSHYSDEIQFYSPFIPLLKFNDAGLITNKTELRRYFEIGLKSYPDLKFKFQNLFVGIDTFVIYYTSVNERQAAEVFQLNGAGIAIRVHCNYAG